MFFTLLMVLLSVVVFDLCLSKMDRLEQQCQMVFYDHVKLSLSSYFIESKKSNNWFATSSLLINGSSIS